MKYRDRPLFWQFLLPMLVVMALWAVSISVAVVGIRDSRSLMQGLYSNNVSLVLGLQNLERHFSELHLRLLQHLESERAPRMERLASDIRARQRALHGELVALEEAFVSAHPDSRVSFQGVHRFFHDYVASIQEVIWLSGDFEKEAAFAELHRYTHQHQTAIADALTNMTRIEASTMTEMFGRWSDLDRRNALVTLIATTSSGLLSLGILFWIVSRTARRLRAVADCSSALGDGDLSARVADPARDEIGSLGRDLEQMASHLSTSMTELEMTADDLRQSEESFRAILESSPVPLVITSLADTSIKYGNSAFANLFGVTEERLSNRRLTGFHVDPTTLNLLLTQGAEHGSVRDREVEFVRDDGTVFLTSASAQFMVFEGTRALIIGFSDITRRKQAERALAELNELLERRVEERTAQLSRENTERKRAEEKILVLNRRNEMILNAAGEGIFGLDQDGNIVFINPAGARMVGWDAEDLIGESAHQTLHHTKADGSPYPQAECPIHGAVHDGAPRHVEDESFWRKDQTPFPVEYVITPVEGEEDTLIGAVVVFRDITERKESQAQMIQVSKLASLGEMATGVAHELNQPLNVIRMAADAVSLMQEKGEVAPDFLHKRMEWISTQTVRAATIIDHLRVFGRKASEDVEPISVLKAVTNSADFIREQMRLHGIQLDIDLPETCHPVNGHFIQLEQVIMNLLGNARDAIERKVDEEETSDVENRIRVTVEDDPEEDSVRLSIEDTGGGIPEDVLPKIFDPFFTTKGIGKGTGVGLSISYGIVVEMGGTIVAENTDHGARFTLSFPIAEETPAPA